MKRTKLFFWWAALVALVQAGCGNSLPPAPDPATAREALRVSLDAWKNGNTADSLKNNKPAIIVGDPQWKPDVKLLDFEIRDKQTPQGGNLMCRVDLTLETNGKTVRRHAVYAVATNPKIVVIRDEDAKDAGGDD